MGLGKLPGMARKLRVEYPEAIYHVMNRGDRREPIFKDDTDRRRLEEPLEQRRGAQDHLEYKAIRRGWFLGDEALKKELLAQMSDKAGKSHYGYELRESAEAKAKAERIVTEEMKRLEWSREECERRHKRDHGKTGIARQLRRETIVTLGWIAARLQMSSVSMVAHCLRRLDI